MSFYLGIDISTTGAKALLIDDNGNVTASATTPLSLSNPRPLWSEQNPEEWWSAICNSINGALHDANITGDEVKAIGLTGQMHGLVLLDAKGEVLRPAILWNDQRCGAECDEMRDKIGAERLISITGNDALTGFTAPKILWVQKHEPDVYKRVSHILLPKDFVRYKLTGAHAMDKADGSGTILFDLKKRDWSKEVLMTLGIAQEWLPETFEGPQATGEVTTEAAEATGLKQGTPVVAGGGDQAAQAVGVGAVRSGVAALTLGTSGVVFVTTDGPIVEPLGRLHAFCHALPNRWHLMGVMLSAAGSLQWYRDKLNAQVSFDELVQEAANVPVGSQGLLFLPYLSGERTPHPDPLARGAWIGLTLRHGRAQMTRSLLEGVAFGLKDGFEILQGIGVDRITQVRVSGGGAKSPLWKQILADVINAELVTVNTTEGAAYGAALLAGVYKGTWSSIETACDDCIKITGDVTPNESDVKKYAEIYACYGKLYDQLKSTFIELSAFA